MTKKSFKVRYYWDSLENRREKTHTFVKTEYFCLNCGEKQVWTEPGSNVDYGGGDLHVCSVCGNGFYGYTTEPNAKIVENLKVT